MAPPTPYFGHVLFLFPAWFCLSVFGLGASNADGTTLLIENPVEFIQMDADGGTVLPFDFSELNANSKDLKNSKFPGNDPDRRLKNWRQPGIPSNPGQYSSNSERDPVQEIQLALGFDNHFLSLIKFISDKSLTLFLTPETGMYREALMRDILARATPKTTDFRTSILLGDTDIQYWLRNNRWADFQTMAMANMAPSTLYWLEGNQWAAFHSAPPVISDGSTPGGPAKNVPFPNKTTPPHNPNAQNYRSSLAPSDGAARAGKKHMTPVGALTFKAFVLKVIHDMLRSPVTYIVAILIILVFTARKVLRFKRQ